MNNRPKVVCMLTYGYWPACSGGAENQCRLQSHELSRRGHRCIVLTALIKRSLPRHEKDGDCDVVRICVAQPAIDTLLNLRTTSLQKNTSSRNAGEPERAQLIENRGSRYATMVQWLNAAMFILGASIYLFRQRKVIDIIHTHVASWNAGFAGWIGSLLGIPVLCKAAYLPAFHEYKHSVPFSEKWCQWRKRIRYIALTAEMANDLAFNGIPREMIHIIPNGVSIPDDIATVETNRSVLYVGNFTQGVAHKGFDILIEAWAIVHRELPNAHLVIAGSGDSGPWQDMAAKMNCEKSITFAGHISNMAACYRQAALLVLPSRAEGISNALLEASSFGIPAVASDIPGNREVIVPGQTGLIVPLSNAWAFADAIKRLLLDNGLRKKMGRAARQRIITHFSIASVANKICKIYDLMSEQGFNTSKRKP